MPVGARWTTRFGKETKLHADKLARLGVDQEDKMVSLIILPHEITLAGGPEANTARVSFDRV